MYHAILNALRHLHLQTIMRRCVSWVLRERWEEEGVILLSSLVIIVSFRHRALIMSCLAPKDILSSPSIMPYSMLYGIAAFKPKCDGLFHASREKKKVSFSSSHEWSSPLSAIGSYHEVWSSLRRIIIVFSLGNGQFEVVLDIITHELLKLSQGRLR